MPWIAVGLAALFGVTGLLREIKDTQEQTERSILTLSSVAVAGVGAFMLYMVIKKRKIL